MEIDTEHKHLSFQGRESNMVFETTLPSTSVFSSPQENALYEESHLLEAAYPVGQSSGNIITAR